MPEPASIDSRLRALAREPFRARFHLRGRDAATVELRGMDTIRRHAGELLAKRLAPAAPHKDGKQTPYRGHPVFVAQHATADLLPDVPRVPARHPEGPRAHARRAGIRRR